MDRVPIKVTRAFRGNAVGSEMSVSANEAKFLVLSNHANYITAALTPEKLPIVVAVVETADESMDSAETKDGEESNSVEISTRTGLPKRQYRRRDLTAE